MVLFGNVGLTTPAIDALLAQDCEVIFLTQRGEYRGRLVGSANMERHFYLLAYDICNDKRRRKIARLCEAVAERVQDSLFEAYLTRPELDKLLKKSERWLNEQEDSLRVYWLCEGCRERTLTRGQGRPTPPPGVVIV